MCPGNHRIKSTLLRLYARRKLLAIDFYFYFFNGMNCDYLLETETILRLCASPKYGSVTVCYICDIVYTIAEQIILDRKFFQNSGLHKNLFILMLIDTLFSIRSKLLRFWSA